MEHDSLLANAARKPLSPQDFADVHLRFLQQHGAATHTVFVDSNVPDWQDVARRLQSDISQVISGVVPLGDGRLAISCPFGLPAALGSMPIKVTTLPPVAIDEPLHLGDPVSASSEASGALERISDRLDGIDFALGEIVAAQAGTNNLSNEDIDETLLALLAELSALRDIMGRMTEGSVADAALADRLQAAVSDLQTLTQDGMGALPGASAGASPRGIGRLFATLVETISRLDEAVTRLDKMDATANVPAPQPEPVIEPARISGILGDILAAQDGITERLSALEDAIPNRAINNRPRTEYLKRLRQAMDAEEMPPADRQAEG